MMRHLTRARHAGAMAIGAGVAPRRFAPYHLAMRLPSVALSIIIALAATRPAVAQSLQPKWSDVERETLEHFQALLRLDTRNPPGNERRAADYLKSVFDREGIPARILALDSNRTNVVARLKGTGRKRPLLIMGHTDVVTVDSTKWTHPPFAATRDGGYVYGRGAVDDKDNVTASQTGAPRQ